MEHFIGYNKRFRVLKLHGNVCVVVGGISLELSDKGHS